MKHLLPLLCLCLLYLEGPSQALKPQPIIIIDSATGTALDSATVMIVKWNKKGNKRRGETMIVNGTDNIKPGYTVAGVSRRGYKPVGTIREKYYKTVNFGKTSTVVLEIPMQKIKSGVKLVPK